MISRALVDLYNDPHVKDTRHPGVVVGQEVTQDFIPDLAPVDDLESRGHGSRPISPVSAVESHDCFRLRELMKLTGCGQ